MSGFEISGGQIVITNGARTVATTGGTLLQFLTASATYTTNLVFPDATKGELYQWQYAITRAPGDNFAATRLARSTVGAKPQEWTNNIVLAAAPAGADIFIGRATLVRTVAPSHTWLGQTISPVIPQSVPIQINGGSMIVEGAIGITRSLTIDIDSGDLVAKLEHSVGPAAGNFNSQGTVPPQVPSTSIPPNNVTSGSENVAVGGVAGFPVYWTDTAPYYINDGQGFVGFPTGAAAAINFAAAARYGGASQATYSDPTNYSSTYSLSLTGRFGRRS